MKRTIDPSKLIWKSEYNTGSFKVDMEHKSLFEVARKALNIRTMQNDEKEIQELKEIIKTLYNYVATHFKNEEKYMQSIDYPELQRHQTVHHEILVELHSFVKTLNELDIDQIEINLYKFIEDYFIYHIVNEDKQIGLWAASLKKLRHTSSWKKEYETGNDIIDDEHKKLFEILEEAFVEVEDKDREKKIKTVLTHLYDYMKKHFSSEEHYMRTISYPNLAEHKQIHKEIIQHCNELLLSINKTDDKLFEKKLARFIDHDMVDHMLKDDNKIVQYKDSKETKD